MMRLAVFVSICALALVASKSTVARPKDYVVINGINYYFATEVTSFDYVSANDLCTAFNMTLAGMETEEEWLAVTDYMTTNGLGLSYGYWTSGQWVTSNWTWASTGTTFSAEDPRWGLGEPGPSDREAVSIDVRTKSLWAEDFTDSNHAVCEELAPSLNKS